MNMFRMQLHIFGQSHLNWRYAAETDKLVNLSEHLH